MLLRIMHSKSIPGTPSVDDSVVGHLMDEKRQYCRADYSSVDALRLWGKSNGLHYIGIQNRQFWCSSLATYVGDSIGLVNFLDRLFLDDPKGYDCDFIYSQSLIEKTLLVRHQYLDLLYLVDPLSPKLITKYPSFCA